MVIEQLVNWFRYNRNGDNPRSKSLLRMAQPNRYIVNAPGQLVNLRCGTWASMGRWRGYQGPTAKQSASQTKRIHQMICSHNARENSGAVVLSNNMAYS